MKTVWRRSLTTLMCVGTLIAGTQSWAKDISSSNTTKMVKAQEPCSKPCKMGKADKIQQDHSHQSTNNSAQDSNISDSMKVLLQEAGGLRYVP